MMHEDRYWQAVLDKDKRSNGEFVYAVRSTGVYCNPGCPSRRPRREHVVFFTQPSQAEEAGFRPCRRCHPQDMPGTDEHTILVQRLCVYMDAHIEEPLPLATLGAHVAMSPYHLQRVFKREMGITPRQYIEAYRVQRLKDKLRAGEPVTEALYDVGYSSSSRLYERVPTQFGMTPTTYQRGGKGMSIDYTIVDCPLGRLLVAATTRGICAVYMGSADTELEAALVQEYPAAAIQHDGADLSEWTNVIVHHLAGQQRALDLPLDVQATAFQWRVWHELRAIPYGETRSYSEVAQALGDANKARAVAQACATNPVALIVPCHRVVRGDGNNGGYRWGLERKQQLLEREAQTVHRER